MHVYIQCAYTFSHIHIYTVTYLLNISMYTVKSIYICIAQRNKKENLFSMDSDSFIHSYTHSHSHGMCCRVPLMNDPHKTP
jgi:hypothetical protein